MAIDTLQLSKELQDVDFPRGQADALARIFLEHTDGRFKGEIEGIARRLDSVEAALQSLREEVKAENRVLRAEIKEGDASLKVDLVKWIVGSLVLNLVGTAGLVITLIKLIPR